MLIADLIAGHPNEFEKVFSPDRKAYAGTWEYLMENKDFPTLFIKDRLAKTESVEDLRKVNCGAVVKMEGKKRAVYRDASGAETVLSPVCPHMGCIVSWNEAENTWDCPCHGSRFAPTGEVLNGPAETGLERCN